MLIFFTLLFAALQAEEAPRDTFRYGSVSHEILAGGWFHEHEMNDPAFMESLMAKARTPEIEVGSDAENFTPVIFIPGMTGAVIEAKVEDKEEKVSILCWSNSDWYMVYGGVDITDPEIIKILAPGIYECTLDNLRLHYEANTGRAIPIQGVATRIRGEHLDTTEFNAETDDPITRAFGEFSADLHWGQGQWGPALFLEMLGYVKYQNLWHAPYDFRKSSVDFVEKEYPRLKQLTEHMYKSNGNKKVAYIGISMGGPYLSSFMTYVDQFPGWKEQYVDSMFTVAGVFGGAIYNLGTLIFGETYGIPYIDASNFQRMYKSWGCATWLTPMEGNENNKVVVRVKELDGSTTEYRVDDLQAFFESVPDLEDSMKMKRDYFNENEGNRVHQPYHDPGVKVHCMLNSDSPTYGVIELDRASVQTYDAERNAAMTVSDQEFTGDGVANYEELSVCRDWANARVWESNGFYHASEANDWPHMQYIAAQLTGQGENPVACTEVHTMETECSSSSEPACPDGWKTSGDPTTDGCPKRTSWCWGSGCDDYKRTCTREDWWTCADGKKCGEKNLQCLDNVTPTTGNVDKVTYGSCVKSLNMSEGECEAYANLVDKKFEYRSKSQQKGCYEKTVHGIDFVLFQKVVPETPLDCSSDAPCLCWKNSLSDGGAVLAESELAEPKPRDTFRYGSVSEDILAGGWFHEHEMYDPEFMKNLMSKAKIPEVKVGSDSEDFTPVIFIPGMTGAIIEAKIEDKENKVSIFCWSNSDWYMVYGGVDVTNPDILKIMAPGVYECTFDNLRLKYEAATGKHVPIQGVLTRVKGEHLDATEFNENDDPITRAFGDFDADLHWGQDSWGLAKYLQMIGFTEYVNLWHAPYDFRKSSVDFVEKDYPRLKQLTEHVYTLNGNKKVAYIGVSMGGPYLSSYLVYLDQFPGWKEQHVEEMYTFAGVFGGAIYNLGTLIFGETYGIPYIDAAKFQRMYKAWGCATWLTPMEGNENNKVIVKVKELDGSTTEYRVNDLEAFFESVPDLEDSMKMKRDYFNEEHRVHQPYHDPGVKTHCFFNADSPTYGVIELDRSDVQKYDPERIAAMAAHGEFTGDSVANYEELAVCRDWADTRVWETNGFTHASEMADLEHMQYVAAHLVGKGENPQSCTQTHLMQTECGSEEDPKCPEGWNSAGEPTTDGCEKRNRWCWGDGCNNYKRTCFRQDWWVCDDGQKCGPINQQCFDDVTPTNSNVDKVLVGECSAKAVMSEGECEAYANMVGKKFELRGKNHQKGCYEKTVHGIDFVLYQKTTPGEPVDCSLDAACVCWKSSAISDGGSILAEQELATPQTEIDIDEILPEENFSRYFLLFGLGALLGAWHCTRAKKDDERLPLLEYV